MEHLAYKKISNSLIRDKEKTWDKEKILGQRKYQVKEK